MKVIFPEESHSFLRSARPGAIMSQYVDYYFEVKLNNPGQDIIWHTSLPTLNTLISVNLDGSGWGYQDKAGKVKILRRPTLVGHTLDTRENKHLNGMHNFFVSLKPGFVTTWLRCTNKELYNTAVDLDYLFKGLHLEERLCELDAFGARIAVFESIFKQRFAAVEDNVRYQVVQNGLSLFQKGISKGQDLQAYSRQLAVSYPTLYRYFKAITGHSPNFCQKLIKFRQALRAYKAEGYLFDHWEYGFTDYSHFVKVSRQLTGRIPSEL